jgi:RNA polymerase sigma-70 factor (ECF subfamily)
MPQNLDLFIKGIKKGSRETFNQLFEVYYRNLCRFAFTFVKDSDAAEEIVQELFISIWEQRQNLSIRISIRAFLYTSVKNRSINYLRNNKTRIFHEDEFAAEQNSKVENIINYCEQKELKSIVEKAINELPLQCRAIFVMKQKQNLSNKDIAAELNLSVKTVENQMNIALKKLRQKLTPFLDAILIFFL